MGSELFDLLGIDPDDLRTQHAINDARDVERLIDALVTLRARQGLTQADVAEEMETTQSAVSKFERAGGDPHISTIQRYARAVGACVKVLVKVTPSDSAAAWQATYRVGVSAPAADEVEDEPIAIPPIRIAS
jgi:transcriptional regulator with XRE-family HTH domain